MACTVLVMMMCLASVRTLSEIDPFVVAALALEEPATSLFLYNSLNQRIRKLETGTRSDGCESGVIGPFNALTNIATLRFRSQYSSPPTLILALSDLATLNLNTPLSFQIRPGQITTTEATVTFMDNTNSIEAANISYMVCPNAKGDVINNI